MSWASHPYPSTGTVDARLWTEELSKISAFDTGFFMSPHILKVTVQILQHQQKVIQDLNDEVESVKAEAKQHEDK